MRTAPRLLVVDDDDLVLQATSDMLRSAGYEVSATCDPRKALSLFQDVVPDVCVLDYHMPQMRGSDLAKVLKEHDSAAAILFLTGEDEARVAVEVMKGGALDYLFKPVTAQRLQAAVERAIDHRRLVKANRAYQENLEAMVEQQTRSLRDSMGQLERLSAATLETLGLALDFRDHSTSGHSRRVAGRTTAIARKIGISGDALIALEQGAFLHDIGKLRIPDSVLLKPGSLTASEWEIMRRHPQYGREFLGQIDFLAEAAQLVYTHHEKFDGSGYPQGLKGMAIPVGSRIFAVVDAIDAMTFPRPYNQPISLEQALLEVQRCRGKHFDPDIVDVAIEQAAQSLE